MKAQAKPRQYWNARDHVVDLDKKIKGIEKRMRDMSSRGTLTDEMSRLHDKELEDLRERRGDYYAEAVRLGLMKAV